MGAITIESRRDGDSEKRQDLSRHAFAKSAPYDPEMPRVPPERDVCAYSGDRLVGAAATIPGDQYFGGRPVPMGGIASVIVLPEVAGKGIAGKVMRESFSRMRSRGECISTLYPTLPPLYRGLGYGTAGSWMKHSIPLTDFRSVNPAGTVCELTQGGLGALRVAYEEVAPRFAGWVQFTDLYWDRVDHAFGNDPLSFAYELRRPDGSLGGAVLYRLDLDQPVPSVEVQVIAGIDADDWPQLFSILQWNHPAASDLVTTLPEALLFAFLPGSSHIRRVAHSPWMTRIVDLGAALEARGWTPRGDVEIHLLVHDDVIPDNSGKGVLRVRDGTGTFEPGGRGDIELGVDSLASIYSGWLTPTQAQTLGMATEHRVGALDDFASVCVGGPPSCLDHF